MSAKIDKGSIVLDLTGRRKLGIVLDVSAGEVVRASQGSKGPDLKVSLLVDIQKDGEPVVEERKLGQVTAAWVALTNKPMMDSCDFGDRHAPAGAMASLSSNYTEEHAGRFRDGHGPFDLVAEPAGVWWCGQTFQELEENLIFFPSREAALEAGHHVPSAEALHLAEEVRKLLHDHALVNRSECSLTSKVLWQDGEPTLLVEPDDLEMRSGSWVVINGAWNLQLDLSTLRGVVTETGQEIIFDRITDAPKGWGYNSILKAARDADGAFVPRAALAKLAEAAHLAANPDVGVTARLLSTQDMDAGGDAERALCSLRALDWIAKNSGIGERFGALPEETGFVAVASEAHLDAMDANIDSFEP